MELIFSEKIFEANIVENIKVIKGDKEYNVEVYITTGEGLEEPDIDVMILDHGLNYEVEFEIEEFVRNKFNNVQYNRQCN